MRIDILTIFPKMFEPVLGSSIVGRAQAKGVARIQVHDLRRWSKDKHRKVDDRPYGGGPGMVMKPEPFFDAVEDLKKQYKKRYRVQRTRYAVPGTGVGSPYVVLLSPRGKKLTQRKAEALARRPWVVLLCGHYEGVDERVRKGLADEELSIGDYVLTCGELPAMIVADSVVRLLPGALGHEQSADDESFQQDLLEYPQYTRPANYRGMRVPEVLLSGDFAGIAEWRKLQALRRTASQRPDLMSHGPSDSGH
ncbi:MAG: tRNA (guanosine(37)-N1)-methyltransferase TrmD [Candidatus Omnitrophica bacterium]|nr:tRNA (guanosine(37)-N1)-methyltransferase TrmD [Candidatus Omnitrophota bacterium]